MRALLRLSQTPVSPKDAEAVDVAGPMTPPDTVVDRVTRTCRRCGRELTVAERMFYFLEASDVAPWCRECLASATVAPSRSSSDAPDLESFQGGFGRPEATPPPSPDAFENILLDALRMFLTEELRRAGVSLGRFSAGEPRIRTALDLHNETRSLLEMDRLREAIESLRDLRAIVYSIEDSTAREIPPLALPNEPSVEELYTRVLQRASVLAARLQSDLDASMESFSHPEPVGGPIYAVESAAVPKMNRDEEGPDAPVIPPRAGRTRSRA